MEIGDIMSHPAVTVKASATAQFAAEMMALHEVGALPVCEDDALVGIITDRDIVLRCIAQGMSTDATPVHRIMTPNPVALPPKASVEQAAAILRDSRIRRLPVIEDHHAVGMVTLDDIARQWDNDAAILLMVRRVAPRGHRRPSAA
jgi:CBS domain-containing protein